MRKLFSYLTLSLLLFGACNDKVEITDASEPSSPSLRACAAMDVLEAQLAADPAIRVRMESIERYTRSFIESGRINAAGKIEIPVIVNVLYRTASENISQAQIQSQID